MRLRSEGLSWREIDGEAVVLDLHSSRYFRTNRTGTVLLRALGEVDCGRNELIDHLTSAYKLPAGRAADDVDAFVARLADRGLLAPAAT